MRFFKEGISKKNGGCSRAFWTRATLLPLFSRVYSRNFRCEMYIFRATTKCLLRETCNCHDPERSSNSRWRRILKGQSVGEEGVGGGGGGDRSTRCSLPLLFHGWSIHGQSVSPAFSRLRFPPLYRRTTAEQRVFKSHKECPTYRLHNARRTSFLRSSSSWRVFPLPLQLFNSDVEMQRKNENPPSLRFSFSLFYPPVHPFYLCPLSF